MKLRDEFFYPDTAFQRCLPWAAWAVVVLVLIFLAIHACGWIGKHCTGF
jgi:hypothetical protein